jgi:hypothetical protein
MSEISETEIKAMTKEQNYMRGYKDGKSDVLDKISAEIKGMDHILDCDVFEVFVRQKEVLEILEKYKGDSE